jgi:hypothetical protein
LDLQPSHFGVEQTYKVILERRVGLVVTEFGGVSLVQDTQDRHFWMILFKACEAEGINRTVGRSVADKSRRIAQV